MKKKIIFLVLLVVSLIILSTGVFAATTEDIYTDTAKIVIDGEKADVQTIIFRDKVFVAVRDFSKSLGLKVDKWDQNTNTVSLTGASKLKETKPAIIQVFLYIISRALQIAGLLLLFQASYIRYKKDYYFIKKFSTSQTSLRRIALTAETVRTGAYFTAIGTLFTFFISRDDLSYSISVPFIIVLSFIFWFLGLGFANTSTKQNSILENGKRNVYED